MSFYNEQQHQLHCNTSCTVAALAVILESAVPEATATAAATQKTTTTTPPPLPPPPAAAAAAAAAATTLYMMLNHTNEHTVANNIPGLFQFVMHVSAT